MGCGCLVVLIAWVSPRFALFVVWIFTDRLSIALDSFLIGALGFVFLPYTTLFWALAYAPFGGVSGLGWLLVAFGFFADLASWSGSGREAQRRQASS